MRQPMTKDERRTHIMRVAKRLFQQHGYDHVNIADVIRESNVARGTFYLHFSSLEDLLARLFDQVVDKAWERIAPILEEVEDVEACTVETVHAVFRMFDEDDESMVSVFFSGGGEAFLRKREEAMYKKLGGLLVQALERRHEKLYGKARPLDVPKVEWTVAMLISMVANMTHYAVRYVDPADRDAFEASLVQFVVAGVKEHLAPLLRENQASEKDG
jgi:AcrR family transcriptional regulator